MSNSYEAIPLQEFSSYFSAATELSSVALGGKIVSVSDEFFAKAFNLLLVEPAPSLKGQFGPNGALFSGWESRRHNPTYDWCIIKLGTAGTIFGFDIDTAHFNGNEAPEVSVEALITSASEDPKHDDAKWFEILPKVPLGPSARHLFTIAETSGVKYVKLNMYPDGGIARFRVYGHVSPIHPSDPSEIFDLAHVFAGGCVVFTSDQHFGVGSNLILPGRGKDMGDGWETKRSRQKGHKDWVVIKLGAAGLLSTAEIDTAHFKGNFPESCELDATTSTHDVPTDQESWTPILSRVKLGPHRQHFFQLENVEGVSYTHVRLTIHPDGGIKRIRVNGRRAGSQLPNVTTSTVVTATDDIPDQDVKHDLVFSKSEAATEPEIFIPVLPLTPEAFSPFGQVVQAYGDHTAAPRGTKITPANQGTASKFHKLALIESSYPPESGETTGLSVYRCEPVNVLDGEVRLNMLERHPFTKQGFIPMGGRYAGIPEAEALNNPGKAYLVVVAKTGQDDKPDLSTLRAFIASAAQGIMYNTAVWHQPMTVLDRPMDFTCVETQIGNGEKADCEIVEVETIIKMKLLGL
ncbi:hypothetical protein SERLA73DRAFT_88261 [Serpula lacrymans var. lacrymans S7.3]|uniref:Allantoicase domain-containing protein n=2 Tax=Serpula lacrymans var. lacrymans TaxID=341189 RepID=F8PUG2_SERL3|nr:uncharacterized protein SERLADRAFT_355610 [Serpula lacrymans var. lacrymans S7.9]EGN99682.1 hypothetical protein SERLA73DRAFT_88261 [Serpula lacrymans var. lacrymans S7.3]EGO25242.1 hypothetical protein SERLADRAFT_355610 [Serpula lacrymans var. lacrymans S7.9]